MRKLVVLFALCASFAIFGFADASTANTLQPAGAIYNEDLTVNGTGRFNSIYIGSEAEGGVTFFNGTIVNVGENTPVTFGDDVRIDGRLTRGVAGDNKPVIVDDDFDVNGTTRVSTLHAFGDINVFRTLDVGNTSSRLFIPTWRPVGSCSGSCSEVGELHFDSIYDKLCVCGYSGWKSVDLN